MDHFGRSSTDGPQLYKLGDLKKMKDPKLVEIFKSGDHRTIDFVLNVIISRYQNEIINQAFGTLKNKQDAQDVFQVVSLKIISNIHKFEGKSKLSSWIYRITFNSCQDVFRRQKRLRKVDLGGDLSHIKNEPICSEPNENPLLGTIGLEVLNRFSCRDERSKNAVYILKMKYVDGLSIKEIMEETGKSKSAVKTQIHRAKKRIIESLSEYRATIKDY